METTIHRLFQPSGRTSAKHPEYSKFFYRTIQFSKINLDTLRARPSFGNTDIVEEIPPPGFHGTRWNTEGHHRGKFPP
jgi:hypothetical protein